jgi:putative FmdB family regulatory protein
VPVYEYFCPKCQAEFQLMRPFSQVNEPAFCPKCGGRGEKLVSVFASKADYTVKVPSKDAFRKRPKKSGSS